MLMCIAINSPYLLESNTPSDFQQFLGDKSRCSAISLYFIFFCLLSTNISLHFSGNSLIAFSISTSFFRHVIFYFLNGIRTYIFVMHCFISFTGCLAFNIVKAPVPHTGVQKSLYRTRNIHFGAVVPKMKQTNPAPNLPQRFSSFTKDKENLHNG